MSPAKTQAGRKTKAEARPGPSQAEHPQLLATRRTAAGKRAARRMRRGGLVPGVLYGRAIPLPAASATTRRISAKGRGSPAVKAAGGGTIPLVVSRQDFIKFLHARAGEHGLTMLRLEADSAAGSAGGGKTAEYPVLIKQIEHDPVSGEIRHIDFQTIALTEQIRIKIPLVLTGVPVGVKQDSGVLEHFLREVEVECLPTQIPKQIEHDVTPLKIGEAIHVRQLVSPPGARITTDPESVLASVLAPKEEKIEEAAEAVTEPEVIREKKPEAEEAAAEGKEEKKAEKKEEKKEEK